MLNTTRFEKKNWQKPMSDASKIANQNVSKRNNSNKEMYDKKIYGRSLAVSDRVLMKNISKRGGTGKLRTFWDYKICKVVSAAKLKLYTAIYYFCVTRYLKKSLSLTKLFTNDHNHHQYPLIPSKNQTYNTINNNVEPEPKEKNN